MTNQITEVRLLHVPLENDYKHTLHFESPIAQETYFKSKTVKYISSCSYQRKDKYIAYPDNYDDLINCNYVMYKNNSKWYYAFVTRMEYKNDETTWIYIETDVIQTWFFDYTVKPSFVEREHVNDDTIGLHTIPEGLETGPYVIDDTNKYEDLLNTDIVIGSTVNFNSADFKLFDGDEVKKFHISTGSTYEGVFSGVNYFIVTPFQAQQLITTLANTGQSDAIVSMFMAPRSMLGFSTLYDPEKEPYKPVVGQASAIHDAWYDTTNTDGSVKDRANRKPSSLNGYVPKNNKLFTHPYTYLLMSNNSGGAALYKYELFNSPEVIGKDVCFFEIFGATTPGMSIRLAPSYYNGSSGVNNEEGLNLGKFPICSWSNDAYTNWLTQNAVNNTVSIAAGVALTAVGVAAAIPTGGASLAAAGAGATGATAALASAGAAVGGVTTIASTLGQIHAQSFQSPQAQGNLNSGDVTFASHNLTFTAYRMSIKEEYAKIADNFFSMYGYKCHRVKTPLTAHRMNYWYTKTIDVSIDGAIPAEDMTVIKGAYNAGITFWRDPDVIGDYSVDNSILASV